MPNFIYVSQVVDDSINENATFTHDNEIGYVCMCEVTQIVKYFTPSNTKIITFKFSWDFIIYYLDRNKQNKTLYTQKLLQQQFMWLLLDIQLFLSCIYKNIIEKKNCHFSCCFRFDGQLNNFSNNSCFYAQYGYYENQAIFKFTLYQFYYCMPIY